MQGRENFSGRNWLFTVQAGIGSGDDWKMHFPEKWGEKYSFRAYVYEKGEKAKSIHCHTLIRFKSVRKSRMVAADIIKANPGCEVDVQLKRGTWEDALRYIEKQDNTKIEGRKPVIIGELPKDYRTGGKDEEEGKKIREIIKDEGLSGVVEERPDMILKYPNGCKMLKELTSEKSKKRTVCVSIIWGDAGTGKSTWATQEAKKRWDEEDIYHFSKVGGSRDTVWFNGYSGQRCIIMDDVWGRVIPFEYLLKILGNDPLDVEVKGGRESAMWEEVFITSNYDPEMWYGKVWEDNRESKNAFFRRVNRIIHVTKEEEGTVWKVVKEEEVKEMREDFHISPTWERTPGWVRRERRSKEEKVGMHDNDVNVCTKYRKEISLDPVERSDEGLPSDCEVLPQTLPDTPGFGMYWGGGDNFRMDYAPPQGGWMMDEVEKEKAFLMFMKNYNIERRANSAEPLEESEIKAAIRDGRLKYDEKTWRRIAEKAEEIYRSHDISEEEWDPMSGYHDLRHEDEVDMIFNHQGDTNKDEQTFNSQWWEKERIDEIE